jgi:hypothetical protein
MNNYRMRRQVKQLTRILFPKHKNNKILYYSKNFVRQIIPNIFYESKLEKKISRLKDHDFEYLKKRINYYNKLNNSVALSGRVKNLFNFKLKRKDKTYFFDCYEYTRYFRRNLFIDFKFGDVTFVPEEPSVVKSRPLNCDNKNSVVLNLDKVRHFMFVKDRKDFRSKKDMLVGRNIVGQVHRLKFLEMYIRHPLCNIGKINNDNTYPELLRERLTVKEQLEYKFILCLEGNDVATNLKWVMSSQSLAVMPIPKFETWYMEGTLIPNYHYVQIKDDFSDLEERMRYYIDHPDEALQIIKNAHEYIDQFRIKSREDLISLLVLQKYFYKTNQISVSENLKALFT